MMNAYNKLDVFLHQEQQQSKTGGSCWLFVLDNNKRSTQVSQLFHRHCQTAVSPLKPLRPGVLDHRQDVVLQATEHTAARQPPSDKPINRSKHRGPGCEQTEHRFTTLPQAGLNPHCLSVCISQLVCTWLRLCS